MESQMNNTGVDVATGFAAPLAPASSCCSPAEQEACCAPAEKAGCCGTVADAGDGCACQ